MQFADILYFLFEMERAERYMHLQFFVPVQVVFVVFNNKFVHANLKMREKRIANVSRLVFVCHGPK